MKIFQQTWKFSINFDKWNGTKEAGSHKNEKKKTKKRSWPNWYVPCFANSSKSIKWYKKLIIQRGRCCYFTYLFKHNDFEAVFRPPSFDISHLTPTFNLKTLLKKCSGLRELSIVAVGSCMYIGMYLLFNFVASKGY